EPCGESAFAHARRSTDPEKARVPDLLAPLFELRQQPFPADEAIHQHADVRRLRDRPQSALEFLDFPGEAVRVGLGEQRENFPELSAIPFLPRLLAAALAFLPVVHVEPLDMA